MEGIDLAKLLGGENNEELARRVSTYPMRTEQCPATPKFYHGVRKGWDDKDRRHVSGCKFCQQATALEWRIECPGLFTLATYLADGQNFADVLAMRFHLEHDGCRRCELALQTSFVNGLAALLRAGRQSIEAIRAIADRAAVIYAPFPDLAPAGVQFAPLEDGDRFQMAAKSESDDTRVTIRERDSGSLAVSFSTKPEVAEVQLEIIGEKTCITERVDLDVAGDRLVGGVLLGAFEEQIRHLGKDCLILAAPSLTNLEA